MSRSPVLISGIGVVSGAGVDVGQTLESFRDGVRRPLSALPFESSIACPTFQVKTALPELPDGMNNSRTLRLAMHAVREAMGDAGIERFRAGVRVGICIGTTVGCQLNNLKFYAAYRRGENPPPGPVYDFLKTNSAQAIGRLLDISGPRMTVVNACSSGTDAIGVAASWIRAGLCDVAIAGGADEMYAVPVSGFWSLGVMSGQPCAPFDRDRAGLNLGEGAGILILESEGFARGIDRGCGKKPVFEVAGFGSACDAHHLTAPHPDGRGLEAAIRAALKQAGIEPGKIGFINAHGTATQDNDRAEGKVIARVFGDRIPFVSTKGFTGHTLGAAGGLEAAFAVLGLREGWIPGSIGFENAAEDTFVSPARRLTKIAGRYALSTSLAFGGNNAAVIIGRAE